MDAGDVREIDEDTMRFYVVADVHGFYSELQAALTEKGFYEAKEPHKLVVCGDLLDRGVEALKLQEFILELLKKDEGAARSSDQMMERYPRQIFIHTALQ